MAQYNTPQYDYAQRVNSLNRQKGMSDVAHEYGNFVGQQRFQRAQGDRARQFKDRFPAVQRPYAKRGFYDSGLRREAQQRAAQDFQRQDERALAQYGEDQGMRGIQRAQSDVAYQDALLALFNELQYGRAQYDPFQFLGSV